MKRFFVYLLLVFTMVIGANILIFASDENGVNLNTTNTHLSREYSLVVSRED